MPSSVHGLYAIVDPQFGGGRDTIILARELLAGGCRLLQLRVKDPAHRYELARAFVALKREYDFCCIINDDVALARELRADGVHVGTEDMTVAEARTILGPTAIIGYSAATTGLAGALAAQAAGATYIAFGAIFPTNTKGPGHPVQGLPRLQELVRAVATPIVAIGGITRDNVTEVWQTGVSAVAMIKTLSLAPDPRAEASWFVQKLQKGGG